MKELYLMRNDLGPRGCNELAHAIGTMPVIEYVDIRFNVIGHSQCAVLQNLCNRHPN